MSANSPKNDVQSIYAKSIKMLSYSQAQLNKTQKVLKKTVNRLIAESSSNDDVQVNMLLDDIRESTNENISLDSLNSQLDQLFVLTNHSEYQNKNNTVTQTALSSSLLENVKEIDCSETCSAFINNLADKNLSDKETTLELLKLINDASIKSEAIDGDSVNTFVESVADSIDYKYDKEHQDLAQAMHDIVLELSKYISVLKNSDIKKDNVISGDVTAKDKADILSVYAALRELLKQSSIPDKMKAQQEGLLGKLNKPLDSDVFCREISGEIVQFISQLLSSIQTENKALQEFISKTNNQLSDIKKFMQVTFKNMEESINRSNGLEESVNNSVSSIQETVSSSNDINDLKSGISNYLKDIKKQVQDNKLAEKEKSKASSQNYSHILDELNASQKEAHTLKDQLEETNDKLLRDTLTGISNRLAYDERIAVEVSRFERSKSPLTLAVWDLDHFKNINDTYGHDVGDRVLKIFSNLIQKRIRATDMFARVGGEEFILVLPDTPIDIALTLNNELREMLVNCKFNYQDQNIPVTASVGISTFSENDSEAEVLKRADQALYQSKHTGRNRCTVFQDNDEEKKSLE